MAPHSSTLAWKILWSEEPGRCSPWGRDEWDTTEWLHFHFSLLCFGEGKSSPLQCSCLENPRDGVAQSRTRLKRLSSSSSISSLGSSDGKASAYNAGDPSDPFLRLLLFLLLLLPGPPQPQDFLSTCLGIDSEKKVKSKNNLTQFLR